MKFTDSSNRVVISDDGRASFLASTLDTNTLATVLPADLPTLAQLTAEALAQVRGLRAAFFPILAGLQSEALARGNAYDATAIADLQQAMRDITATVLTGATNKPEIELKFKYAWLSALGNAPVSVINAFKGLNK